MTLLKCSREADSHGGALRKDGDDYICWQCWATENDIPIKKSTGRQVLCPDCGSELMTRFRTGAVSVKSVSMQGGKTVLRCDCGYEKIIPNPFGSTPERNALARQPLVRAEARTRRQANTLKPVESREGVPTPSDILDPTPEEYPMFVHDGTTWRPLNKAIADGVRKIIEEHNGTAD